MELCIILRDSSGLSAVVGPFPDKQTAEMFATNVSPMLTEDLKWEFSTISTPEFYMEG